VILESLQVIGETIAEEEFDEHPYATYYDPDALSGNQAIESVVVLRFEEDEDGLNYLGPRLVDPDEPLSMAIEYGYSNRYNQYDHSLTQRASSSITKELDRLFAWPTSEEIGGAADEPLVVALDEAFEREADAIRDDIESREEAIEYKALLTVSLVDENGERYPGEVEVFNRGIRESYMATIETSSSAVECSGETRCTVCDELTRTFGLGANLDNAYTVKKQWPFPEYNSSLAWQSRPLCIDCVVDIEVALDHFIGAQDYGAPGVRCRVIPYALPVDGASERLRRLVKNGREPLIGTGNEQERKRPLSAAWDAYRGEVELGIEDDFLRLAFTHYVRDSAKTHGVAWIDGISTDQVRELETTAETVLDESPVFEQKQLPKPNSPNERQIFTGMWLFGLLTEEIDSNHDGENTGDDSQWAEYTERLLTNGTIPHDAVVASVVREARARWRARLEDEENYPYDGFHIANAYAFLRTCAEHGVLRDARTEHSMKPELLDGEYISFGAGLNEFVDAHPSIATSPGRKAGFILGAAAAQLSNWQIRRGLNRTFVQNRDVARLTTERLTEWQTYVWEKAKTYNAQAGNYGVPWSDAESLFHEAVLTGENEGWNATNDEIRYHYILGVNVGPNVARRAREDRDDSESSDPLPDLEQTAEATDQQ
jgi:hypothetical protein